MNNRVILLSVALLVRIIYTLFFVELEYLFTEDQAQYIQLSQQLPEYGLLGLNVERVPGYPLFLAIISNIFGDNVWYLIATQLFLDSINCVMIGILAQTIFSKGFWVAGIMAVFNLNMIILSASLLTDTLFLFIFIIFIFSIIKYVQDDQTSWLILSITLLSLATMVRSASYYLLLVLPIWVIIWQLWKKDPIVRIGKNIVLYFLIVVTIFGWIHHRNYTQYQSTALVSHTGGHLLNWVVPATYQYSGQGSYQEGQELVRIKLQSSLKRDQLVSLPENLFDHSSYQVNVAKEILLKFGFINIFKAWTVGSVINLLAPSSAYMPIVRSMEHPSFYDTMGDGFIDKLWNYIGDSDGFIYLLILTIGTGISALFLLLALAGVVRAVIKIKNGEERHFSLVIVFILFMLIVYFLIITGPVIGIKYRLPLEPVLILFATYFLNETIFKQINIKKGRF